MATTISSSIALFLIVVLLIVLRKKLTAFLRDDSTKMPIEKRTFSLSRTMIFYWTVIIVISICYIGIVSDNLAKPDKGVLILMAIVAGTATAGKVIDATQSQDSTITRTQDTHETEGFLTDILSDNNGISVSRFQTVAFNIIYGSSFLAIVVTQHVLYNFPDETLTLLGISSGAYALLKIPENKSAPTPKGADPVVDPAKQSVE